MTPTATNINFGFSKKMNLSYNVLVNFFHPADVSTKSDPENEKQTGDGTGQGRPELIGLVLSLN